MKVAVVGGGAAGFFSAISIKEHHPDALVTIFEKSGKLLSKVKVSGGGRCNVTHACFNIPELSRFYPRGGRYLKKAFKTFYTKDTVGWFEKRGVILKTESDNRMFPVTDDSQTIIDCLMKVAERLGVEIKINTGIVEVDKEVERFTLLMKNGKVEYADKLVIAAGGSPKLSGFEWMEKLGHTIVSPVPSLFTFNMPSEKVKTLMGVVANPVMVNVQGTKLKQDGPLLITHWGMSGPAILKLSAWGARELHELGYQFKVKVHWLGEHNEEDLRLRLQEQVNEARKRKIANKNPFQLSNRLWLFLLDKIGVNPDATWGELGKKSLNRLLNVLVNDEYQVSGKTTFKEEFVTCGGVSLKEVDFESMQSRVCPGLYFAGEVLDMDGVTGGFNFQAAWTTGFVAGKLL